MTEQELREEIARIAERLSGKLLRTLCRVAQAAAAQKA